MPSPSTSPSETSISSARLLGDEIGEEEENLMRLGGDDEGMRSPAGGEDGGVESVVSCTFTSGLRLL